MYYSLIILSFVGVTLAVPYWPKVDKKSSSKNQPLSADKAYTYQQYDLGSDFFSRSTSKIKEYDYVSPVDYDYQLADGSEFIPQSYQLPLETAPQTSYGAPFETHVRSCGGSEVLSADGLCVEPEIIRNIFTFAEPDDIRPPSSYGPRAPVPKPKIKFNLVVIQANENDRRPEPLIVPPPQEKTVVLVLKKEGEEEQKIIEVPAPPGLSPEVFFVNYKDGENPVLPGGIDLETALASSATQGTRIKSEAGITTGGGAALGSSLGGSGYNPRSGTVDSGFGKGNDDFRTNDPAWK